MKESTAMFDHRSLLSTLFSCCLTITQSVLVALWRMVLFLGPTLQALVYRSLNSSLKSKTQWSSYMRVKLILYSAMRIGLSLLTKNFFLEFEKLITEVYVLKFLEFFDRFKRSNLIVNFIKKYVYQTIWFWVVLDFWSVIMKWFYCHFPSIF